MYSKTVKIINKTGLHARSAASFCREAVVFESDIAIADARDETRVGNAKSVISVMAMGLSKGTEMVITANGDDEEAAVEALAALAENGFGEEE